MKKKLTALLVLTLVLCTVIAAGASAYTLKKLTSSAKVFEHYSSDAEQIGYLKKGETVAVEKTGKTWTKIVWGGIGSAWIKTKHIKSSDSVKTTTYYVTDEGSGVHSEAVSGAKRIGSLSKGKKVNVVKISSGWAKITYKNDYGYVKTKHLSRTNPNKSNSGSKTTEKTENLADAFKNFVQADYHAVVTPNTNSGYVNLRWGPSTSTRIAGIRYSGAVLKVIAQNSTWCQVMDETTGEVGYMMRRFLVEVPESILTAAPVDDEADEAVTEETAEATAEEIG